MAVSEVQRRALRDGLVRALGTEVADTLMEYLPPTGWSDIARRSDLEALESRLEAKLSDLRSDMNLGLANQTRWFMASQLVLVGATIGSITALAH